MNVSIPSIFEFNQLRQRLLTIITPHHRGRPAKFALVDLLIAKMRQKLFTRDSMENHLEDLTGERLAGSTISRRLRQLDPEQLAACSDALLEPLATAENCPNGFYQGYRLVGIDGTRFSLQNTAGITARVEKPKARCNKEDPLVESAFPKLWASSLVELGPHNPIALRVGCNGEGELSLGVDLLPYLGAQDLLMGDRLYGVGWFVDQLSKSQVGAFVLKVKDSHTSRHIETLCDGSAIVEIDVRSRKRPADIIAKHRVREIRFRVEATDAQGNPTVSEYRLWTNLMDPSKYPARELIDLYSSRWEHEGFYGEIKLELKTKDYLPAQLLETACVEIFAMVWASSLAARQRMKVCELGKDMEPQRVSFAKVRMEMATLLSLAIHIGTIISQEQFQQIVDESHKRLLRRLTPARRDRVCPRKVRKPQKHWPKVRTRTEAKLNLKITLIKL